MAACSRGLRGFFHQPSLRLPSALRIAIFNARPQCAQSRTVTRSFSSSLFRQNIKPSKILQVYARAPRQSYVGSEPVLRAVQLTKKPVLIYRAPDRRLYMLGVYVFASCMIGSGLWVLRFRYELPREGLPFFVGPTYVVVSFIMLAIGAYIFGTPVGRCRAIEVIPNTAGVGPAQLRIYARMVPFFKDRVIYAGIQDVTISEKITPVAAELTEADRARNQNVAEGLEGMFIVSRIWEIAARKIEQKWTSFFLRFKFAVLRFGIVKMRVHGETWKVDCTGFLLEDGQAMDRLIAQE